METIAIQSLMAWFECKIQFRFVCLVTCSVRACRQIRKILNTQSGHRNWWRFSFYYGNHHLFSRTVRPWIIHIYDLPSTFKGTNKTVLNLRPMYDLQSALPTIQWRHQHHQSENTAICIFDFTRVMSHQCIFEALVIHLESGQYQ